MVIRGVWLAFAILATASFAPAQKIVSAKAGFVYFTKGRVWVDNGQLNSGDIRRQLNAGETVFTERGNAEVLLNPGTVLRIGDMTRVRMEDVRLTDACVSLLSGSAVITIKKLPKPDRVELHIGRSGVVILSRPGVYRFDGGKSDINQARLRVFSGLAEVRRKAGAADVPVRTGRAVGLDGLQATRFDSTDIDELQKWAADRSRTPGRRGLQPVPPKLERPVGVPKSQPETPIEAARRQLGLDASNRPISEELPPPGTNGGR